jgi:hypothetical protein
MILAFQGFLTYLLNNDILSSQEFLVQINLRCIGKLVNVCFYSNFIHLNIFLISSYQSRTSLGFQDKFQGNSSLVYDNNIFQAHPFVCHHV